MRVPPGADAVLDRLLALAPGERRAALAAMDGLDPSVRAMLDAILSEAESDDPFLDPAHLAGRPALADLETSLPGGEALTPGTRFAEYEIVALAGRGGMGEVYRAHDERLGRDVALKALPADVSDDPELLARFEREARVLASLNHPNIAAIYGVTESNGRRALVLEFVEGETLAARVRRGPMPPDEVAAVARQIALALDAAHARGIVHRDLKPANITLKADGVVKVLDFGLARARERDHEEPPAGITTVWRPPGSVLGTPAYMSPEQALGKPVDVRADIWAFGCVLFEMLTGARAFEGDSAAEVTARVVEREPDFDRLPRATPEPLRRLVRRALVKDPARRLARIADALFDIDDAAAASGPWRRHRRMVVLAASAALLVAGALAVWTWGPSRGAPRTGVRLALPIPASDILVLGAQQVAALSPDGRTVAYRAARDGRVQLFMRPLDAVESTPIAGTENASAPFFSPDGRWLGFDGDGRLREVSIAGGAPVDICAAPGGANASWAGPTIVFSTSTRRILERVPASGGTPEALTTLDGDKGELAHAFPHVLPRAEAALFTVITATDRRIAAVRFDTREVTVLTDGSQPRYLGSGHLLFVRAGTLWAAPFSEARLTLTGEPAPVLDGLELVGDGVAHLSVAADGTLMFVPRREVVRGRQLVWLGRTGVETPLAFPPALYHRAALSPDGKRLAVALAEDGNTDIWVAGTNDQSWIRLTHEPGTDTAPLWAPDGRSIVFRSERDGGGLFQVSVDAPDQISRLTSSCSAMHTPHDWAPDRKRLLFTELLSYTTQAIAWIDPPKLEVARLRTGAFAQLRPHVSPDGKWLAYQSDESGKFEIYVRPYQAGAAGLWRVSSSGGTSPRWTRDGRELLYYDGEGFVSVPIAAGELFQPGTPSRLFTYAPYGGRLGPDYDVTSDGRRFLLVRSGEDSPGSRAQLVFVEGWVEDMQSRLRR